MKRLLSLAGAIDSFESRLPQTTHNVMGHHFDGFYFACPSNELQRSSLLTGAALEIIGIFKNLFYFLSIIFQSKEE